MNRLPLTLQTTYSDLLQRLQEDSLLEAGGTPTKETRRGRTYWYMRTYIGDKKVKRYLGPDSPEFRSKVERMREASVDLKKREKARRQLVQALQVSSVPRIDAATGKVLSALAKAGFFRLRGVLVGTHAFRLYPLILGVEIPEAHAVTEDVDIAQFHEIAVALDDRPEPALEDAFRNLGRLTPRPTLAGHPTAYRLADGSLVEILAPKRRESEEPIELPALGVYAQPLPFLDFLIANAVQAALPYRYGVLVNVPQPSRYAVHKLLVASRRADVAPAKAQKDVRQAAALLDILAEDQPDELSDAYREAHDNGPNWRQALLRGTRRLPSESREHLEEICRD